MLVSNGTFDGLLIRWSAVRIRPGEPKSITYSDIWIGSPKCQSLSLRDYILDKPIVGGHRG
jgi:hypothetical protein